MKELRVREGHPVDIKTIRQFHDEQNERDGTSYPLPRMFDEMGKPAQHVPITLVVEDNNGELVGSLYVEEVPEMCFAGVDPRATAVARQDIEALCWMLKNLGFKQLRTLVPRVVLEHVRKPLERAGFDERDDLVVFSRALEKEVSNEP